MPVPFQEIRMFHSNGKKIKQFNAFDIFYSMFTDDRTGQIKLDAIDKSEIFCDEINRISSAEMLEKLKR